LSGNIIFESFPKKIEDLMFNEGLVSIIMPAWKADQFISEAIQSVIGQTYDNWELLIVDDCSPDSTVEVVEKFCETDSRITLLKQYKNQGPASARNLALQKAEGRWIAFLDSDDVWSNKKLEAQLVFHQSTSAVLSFTGYSRFTGEQRSGRAINVPSKLNYHQLLRNTCIATSTVLIDRRLSGSFVMKNTYYDDFVCWLDMLRGGSFAVGLNQPLMKYRVLPGSVSRNKIKSAMEVWKILRTFEGLTLSASLMCFISYAFHGILKYARF
jgi:teichuronic acid biosynthesis glycosyltransferase TuaG